jgi:hypothetical protein
VDRTITRRNENTLSSVRTRKKAEDKKLHTGELSEAGIEWYKMRKKKNNSMQ